MEHILPQKPAAGSGWQVAFPGGQAASWLHRMGNLALLHGKRNLRASNRSFQEKKGHYKGTGAVKQYGTAIPLTDSVLQLDRWDPPAAAARQREHIALAIDCWRLDAQAAAVGGGAAGCSPAATESASIGCPCTVGVVLTLDW